MDALGQLGMLPQRVQLGALVTGIAPDHQSAARHARYPTDVVRWLSAAVPCQRCRDHIEHGVQPSQTHCCSRFACQSRHGCGRSAAPAIIYTNP
jgi:hypothetical protein